MAGPGSGLAPPRPSPAPRALCKGKLRHGVAGHQLPRDNVGLGCPQPWDTSLLPLSPGVPTCPMCHHLPGAPPWISRHSPLSINFLMEISSRAVPSFVLPKFGFLMGSQQHRKARAGWAQSWVLAPCRSLPPQKAGDPQQPPSLLPELFFPSPLLFSLQTACL